MNVLFLSEATLKAESVISENVDPKILIPTIKEVQNIYILPLLGTALYNELISQVSGGTVSSDNRTLLDNYITPVMVKYCIYEAILPLSFKMQNKNLAQKSSEFSSQISLESMRYYMDNALNRAQWYAERCTMFLVANPTLYPSYRNQGNAKPDTIYPNGKNYDAGIFLDDDCNCSDIPAHIKYQGNNPTVYCK